MKFILIVYIASTMAKPLSPSISMQEFNSRKQCQAAATLIVNTMTAGRDKNRMIARCIEKG